MEEDRPRHRPFYAPDRVVAGRYRIIRLRGIGGMAEVYEAEDIELCGHVALKIARPELVQAPEHREHVTKLMRREARLGRQLKDRVRGAVFVLDFAHTDDRHRLPFIVMELLDGHTLRTRIEVRKKNGYPLSVKYVLGLGAQLAGTLEELKQQQLIHADLKPENVFLHTAHGRSMLKILDLGLVAWPDDPEPVPFFRGTPPYAAPELHRCERPHFGTDVFALGLILYEAFTLRRPWDDPAKPLGMEELGRLLLNPHTPPPPTVRHYRPDVPKAADDFIMSMVERELSPSARRRPSIETVNATLHRLLEPYLREDASASMLDADVHDRLLATTENDKPPLLMDPPTAAIELFEGAHVPGAITAPPGGTSIELLPATGSAPSVKSAPAIVDGIRDRTDPDPQPLFSDIRDRTDPDPQPPFHEPAPPAVPTPAAATPAQPDTPLLPVLWNDVELQGEDADAVRGWLRAFINELPDAEKKLGAAHVLEVFRRHEQLDEVATRVISGQQTLVFRKGATDKVYVASPRKEHQERPVSYRPASRDPRIVGPERSLEPAIVHQSAQNRPAKALGSRRVIAIAAAFLFVMFLSLAMAARLFVGSRAVPAGQPAAPASDAGADG